MLNYGGANGKILKVHRRGKYLGKIGEEQPLTPEAAGAVTEAAAICWSYGRTLGNIAVFSESLLGRFPKGPETMRVRRQSY